MGRAIDWESRKEYIFELMSKGELTFTEISEAVGVNKITLNHWWRKAKTKAEYGIWLTQKKIEDKSKAKYRTEKFCPDILPCRQNRREEFKEMLKVGQEVFNIHSRERGVIIAKYPHIFTVKTEGGYITSYSYAAQNEFTKRSVEDEQGE